MSSKFVRAGERVEPLSQAEEWSKARQKVAASRDRQQTEATGIQEGGKSLYEHLQEQKLAKQEAFEEASKIRHQFRPLNESEADFLESVRRAQRLKDQGLQKETDEQLDAFRRERLAAEEVARDRAAQEKAATSGMETSAEHTWSMNKRRRRADDGQSELSVKSRRISKPGIEQVAEVGSERSKSPRRSPLAEVSEGHIATADVTAESGSDEVKGAAAVAATPAALLVSYSSDSDG